ncbi:hypothetical protein WDV06_14765 [Streptomyces racemochromogenes]|uniref:DUF4386 domain-containing protein n=1 Tax=Streptomyces racemochromogenes TaxID=67353 RepID=A0ABW7PD94_9ACTN
MTATPDTLTSQARSRRDPQAGPPPGILAVVFTALFLAGLVLGTLLAGGDPFPSPFGTTDTVTSYFRDHTGAVQVSGTLQFAASVPLAIYAATVSARLHKLGIRAPGATIALTGGVLASAFLACSGLVTWVLSRPEVAGRAETARALQYLAFGLGGPAHVVLLGLLIAGMAVPGLLAGLLPRALALAGLAIAAVAELSTLVLLTEATAPLLPVARFAGLLWLIAAGFLLPRRRVRTEG